MQPQKNKNKPTKEELKELERTWFLWEVRSLCGKLIQKRSFGWEVILENKVVSSLEKAIAQRKEKGKPSVEKQRATSKKLCIC